LKKLDKLIISEVFGPWVFGVAIFTVLIMAGSFLFQFTNYLVKGVSMFTVIELTVLLLPGIIVKTFSMAMLLGTLLAFGRLSGESELIAIRAAGTSLVRVISPVVAFGAVVAGIAFGFNEYLVPRASIRAEVLKTQISKQIEGSMNRPTSYPIVDKDGNLQAYINAKNFDLGSRVLTGVTIISYDNNGKRSFTLEAEKLSYVSDKDWKIVGNSSLTSVDGSTYVVLEEGAWPKQVAEPKITPEDILAQSLKDLDAQSMGELKERIKTAKASGKVDKRQIINLEYGYWNKISVPLAAVVYALVGAPLGIRNHRSGAASGFWLAVIIIFIYMLLSNVLAITAQGGAIPAWVASFTPIVLGVAAGAYLTYIKNR
jgi:lipopolysaccharide export system permease protein